MTQQQTLVDELQRVVQAAEVLASVMRAWHAGGIRVPREDLEDHRLAVHGQLVDAINVAAPGLGTALHMAMYPIAPPTPGNDAMRTARHLVTLIPLLLAAIATLVLMTACGGGECDSQCQAEQDGRQHIPAQPDRQHAL